MSTKEVVEKYGGERADIAELKQRIQELEDKLVKILVNLSQRVDYLEANQWR